jgi:hypothetical protein
VRGEPLKPTSGGDFARGERKYIMPKDDGRSSERADEDPQINEHLSAGGGLSWEGRGEACGKQRGGMFQEERGPEKA